MEKSEKGLETVGFYNLQLVFFYNQLQATSNDLTVTSQVTQGESGLTLNLETLAVHQSDEALHKLRFGSSQFLPVVAFY